MAVVELDRLPVRAAGAAVERLALAAGLLTSCSLADPLGHRRPREIGESGSPSIWTTRLVLDEDPLPAADGAVGAHALDDLVGGRRCGARARGCAAEVTAGPRPRKSPERICRTTGQDKNVFLGSTAAPLWTWRPHHDNTSAREPSPLQYPLRRVARRRARSPASQLAWRRRPPEAQRRVRIVGSSFTMIGENRWPAHTRRSAARLLHPQDGAPGRSRRRRAGREQAHPVHEGLDDGAGVRMHGPL